MEGRGQSCKSFRALDPPEPLTDIQTPSSPWAIFPLGNIVDKDSLTPPHPPPQSLHSGQDEITANSESTPSKTPGEGRGEANLINLIHNVHPRIIRTKIEIRIRVFYFEKNADADTFKNFQKYFFEVEISI